MRTDKTRVIRSAEAYAPQMGAHTKFPGSRNRNVTSKFTRTIKCMVDWFYKPTR